MFRKLDFYGYDRETYEKIRDYRNNSDTQNTGIVLTMFIIVMLFASVFSYFFDIIPHAQFSMYFRFFLISLVYQIILITYNYFTKGKKRHPIIAMYILVMIIMSFAIYSSVSEPFYIAPVFPAFILVCGVAFMDRMYRFSAMMIICYLGFVVSSHYTKPPSIARFDLLYATIFLIIAIIFHYRFQHGRTEQFLSFQKNLEIQHDLEVQSSFDNLSGLLVRGRFFSLADLVIKSQKDAGIASLIIMNLDAFKQINDTYGHQMGDKAIQVAAKAIWDELGVDLSEKWTFCERTARFATSFAGRLGGDEFIIFMREEGGIDMVTARLQQILNKLNNVEMGDLRGIHASFGVTEISESDRDIDSVYTRADSALYNAKSAGKNRIVEG